MRILVFLYLFLVSVQPICAQQDDADEFVPEEFLSGNLAEQLAPLETLIEVAIKNNPTVKYNQAMVEKSQEEVILEKRSWQEHFSGFANYSKGNQMYMMSSPLGSFRSSFLNGYRYGINFDLPVTLITTRKPRIRAATAELRAAEFQKKQAELELSNLVIKSYYELLASHRVIKIKEIARQNADLNNQLAEKKFREGALTLEEYTNVTENVSGAMTDYEIAMSVFMIQYKQLEKLLGVSLESLRRKK